MQYCTNSVETVVSHSPRPTPPTFILRYISPRNPILFATSGQIKLRPGKSARPDLNLDKAGLVGQLLGKKACSNVLVIIVFKASDVTFQGQPHPHETIWLEVFLRAIFSCLNLSIASYAVCLAVGQYCVRWFHVLVVYSNPNDLETANAPSISQQCVPDHHNTTRWTSQKSVCLSQGRKLYTAASMSELYTPL